MEHTSVLLEESIALLDIKPNGIYIDGTLGRGGHSKQLLQKLEHGHLYAFDKDQQAIEESTIVLNNYLDKVTFIHEGFEHMQEALLPYGVDTVDGILLDLGVSSPQFDDPERGFSYRFDAPLDMRMDQTQIKSAQTVVNQATQEELASIFRNYGEERYANRIAQAIVERRREKVIVSTFELVDIIKQSLPAKELNKKGHPAKKVFQALRIEVNDELTSLSAGIKMAANLLNHQGRLAIITFHSLEDRIVKNAFKALSTAPSVDPKLPILPSQMEQSSFSLVTKKPILPTSEEIEQNHRAHSAKLRVLERK